METEEIVLVIQESGTELVLNLLAAIVIFLVGRWVALFVHRLVVKAMERAKLEPILVKFLGNMIYALLLIFVVLAAISQVGIQTTSLIAVLGAAGLAVGLALQGSLANFAAGVLIIIFRPYRVGDYIEGGGVAGTIDEVQIFTTVLNTPDNRRVIVPNGQMMSGTITNYSSHPTRRVDLVASVSYDDDSDKVREVLRGIVASDERVLKEPAPNIRMSAHGDSSVDWIVRPWVKAEDYWGVYWDLPERIKRRFDEEGITIPYPQRDVHLYHHELDGEGKKQEAQ
ncbi:MAG: mechanosensitive ion channel [Ectothiorhodospiraceae bacterium]|nr:mechanosensitive ion channel [Ectothiorhodospiraceae bacterium]